MMGWIVGGIAAFIFWLSALIFPLPIAIVLSTIASVWVTGAFHEDGFTDVCDAFGGGWTKEQIMTIMKDSRIGAYGVIAVVLLVLLKVYALNEIGLQSHIMLVFCLINGHTSSRFMASTMVHTHDYVQDIDKSKVRPIANSRLSLSEMLFSFAIALIPFLMFQNWMFLLTLPICYVSKMYLGYYFKKHIGGYTGDCLGATQQITEVIFYLSIIALWKFM
jgi:adenosylcobinamide-GDP ribazoletransferase